MTIDSAYFIQVKKTDSDVRYTFEFETIDTDAVEVYLFKDGNRILLERTTETES